MACRKLLFEVLLLITVTANSQKARPVILNAKSIEKNMARVSDSLYAYKYETTNEEYRIFLVSLKLVNTGLYEKYRVDSVNWPLQYCEPTPLFYHRHPVYNQYPVVNVSYEGANEYCKWLTEKYNADPKRKFKKVVFMLPSEKVRVQAAQGGRSQAMFPWGNYYLVNKKGFYMCNFKPVGDAYHVRDSAGNPMIVNYNGNPIIHSAEFPPGKTFYTMKVASFVPNDLGIYDMSGNVAEMISEPGFAMGGSWNSYGGEVYTKSIKQYKYPSPEVGFRVFMKIIEQ